MSISKSAERRVRHELEKRGLPTFGSYERCRARLDRHLEAERKPAKKNLNTVWWQDDETPVASISLSFHDANGRAFPIRRHPVMNPETDIDWEMNEINEAAERDDAETEQVINAIPDIAREALNEEQREEGEIRDEEGIAAWQNFIVTNRMNHVVELYREYVDARLHNAPNIMERFLDWHEFEDALFVHQNGFANPREE
jgi:hypothetical protein